MPGMTGVESGVFSEALYERLKAEHGEACQIGWKPNACWYCSGLADGNGDHRPYQRDRGTGVDPYRATRPCPECYGKHGNKIAAGYGPQGLALVVKDFEVLLSGPKAYGKTSVLTTWLVSGNPGEPEIDPKTGEPIAVNMTYLAHPDYRALVVRKDAKDLSDWLSYAEPYYKNKGLRLRGSEFICDATGARIYTGHLHDSASYMHVAGISQLHRLWIDEAAQIGEQILYDHLYSCLRTKHAELRCQVMLSTNWIGPGVTWIRERFLESVDYKGEPAKPFRSNVRVIEVEGRKVYRSRMFITGTLRDNPTITSDYAATLKDLSDPKLRAVYYDGDPYAFQGTFFGDLFRPNGPQKSEAPNADHVIPRYDPEEKRPDKVARVTRSWNPHHKLNKLTGYPEIGYWWPRAIGGDWGYAHDAAFLWAARHPESDQIILYREYTVSGLTARLLGVEVARRSKPDLEKLPGNAITLYFSHDAFQQRGIGGEEGTLSTVELFAQGIAQVLGPDAVWMPELEIKALEEAARNDVMPGFEEKFRNYKKSILEQRRKGITIRMANRQRIHGWQVMREMMVWRRPFDASLPQFDPKVYEVLCREQSVEAGFEYQQQFRRREPVLPQLQILETECPRVIAALPKLVSDEKRPEDCDPTHFPGMDSTDCMRYLLTGFREEAGSPPLADRRDEYAARWREQHPDLGAGAMIEVMRFFESEQHAGSVPLRSAAGRLRVERARLRKGYIQ